MAVVPHMSKQPPDTLAGLMECIKMMNGKPKLIYIDDEGAYNNQSVIDFLKDEKLNYIEPEDTQHLRRGQSGRLKIVCIRESRTTRRKERLFNGQIMLMKLY